MGYRKQSITTSADTKQIVSLSSVPKDRPPPDQSREDYKRIAAIGNRGFATRNSNDHKHIVEKPASGTTSFLFENLLTEMQGQREANMSKEQVEQQKDEIDK